MRIRPSPTMAYAVSTPRIDAFISYPSSIKWKIIDDVSMLGKRRFPMWWKDIWIIYLCCYYCWIRPRRVLRTAVEVSNIDSMGVQLTIESLADLIGSVVIANGTSRCARRLRQSHGCCGSLVLVMLLGHLESRVSSNANCSKGIKVG